MTVSMPPAVAISAATTFERIPPDPSGDVVCPMSSVAERLEVRDALDELRASGPTRGLAVKSPSTSVSSTSRSAPMSIATCAARKSLSPKEISSVVVVSFSLMTGSTRHSSSLPSVWRALR